MMNKRLMYLLVVLLFALPAMAGEDAEIKHRQTVKEDYNSCPPSSVVCWNEWINHCWEWGRGDTQYWLDAQTLACGDYSTYSLVAPDCQPGTSSIDVTLWFQFWAVDLGDNPFTDAYMVPPSDFRIAGQALNASGGVTITVPCWFSIYDVTPVDIVGYDYFGWNVAIVNVE